MKNTILKLILAIGIIAFAITITAVGCGKTAGGNNNNNANNSANNSGSGNNGGSGDDANKPLVATTNLVLAPLTTRPPAWIKLSGNTVTINAADLATAASPVSDTDSANRGFRDAEIAGNAIGIFNLEYPGAITGTSVVLYFVNRAHVTKNTIALQATTNACPSNETEDALLSASAGGGVCRFYFNPGGNIINFHSYLGTVFNNTKTTTHARGMMKCGGDLYKELPGGAGNEVVSDTTIFNYNRATTCQLAVVNSAGTAAAAEIDDAWVGDTASTTEVELYAIGIDVTGKTISQWSDATGYNFTEFKKAHDNAAFKELLKKNPWGELKFKVKIVTAANF